MRRGPAVTTHAARAARVYHYQDYTIMVWDKNLVPHLGRPVP